MQPQDQRVTSLTLAVLDVAGAEVAENGHSTCREQTQSAQNRTRKYNNLCTKKTQAKTFTTTTSARNTISTATAATTTTTTTATTCGCCNDDSNYHFHCAYHKHYFDNDDDNKN